MRMRVLIGYDGPAMLPAREEFLIVELLRVSIQLVAPLFSDAAHLAFSVSHRRVLARVWESVRLWPAFSIRTVTSAPTRLIGNPNES